jgi:hypothetical protein
MNKQINPDHTLVFKNKYDRTLPYYDDGFGPLWIFCNSMGIERIIRAQTWEDAYEIAVDERAPIAAEEVPAAYGFDTQAELDAATAALADGDGGPDLIEGYQYQSNSSGTGIVDVDLNGEALDPLTYERLRELEITMTFSEDK